ncbi:hypothetical protein CC85DRAFT_125438 [Cutaneotrichosporon oleaginosum]|uniref:Uncharacterized protein n=1 Tax=Cutaneotrichosporon oleaginosum TaxID=879819 RepID=A0A0J0XJU6_9TREE|nr:uncharacterized protein CC85DRAFT_125438 [Cutaneotrichosporon oleaginosum]KLT41326.1 hypothetical protein CC85DRAFT_125438 [Cutaneotrichosporon oleaginosum]TXT14076.1 hypothetical protein COLE_00269 [Cutaneotrichosporon oleaginosum]
MAWDSSGSHDPSRQPAPRLRWFGGQWSWRPSSGRVLPGRERRVTSDSPPYDRVWRGRIVTLRIQYVYVRQNKSAGVGQGRTMAFSGLLALILLARRFVTEPWQSDGACTEICRVLAEICRSAANLQREFVESISREYTASASLGAGNVLYIRLGWKNENYHN